MRLATSVERLSGWRQLLLAFTAGAAMGIAQAPWSFPFAMFAAVPVLFWLHSGAISKRRAALVGWVAGLGYFGLTLGWIIEPFLVDLARHGWMAPFALMFMAGGVAAFWSLAYGLAKRGSVVSFVVFWALAGLLRSYVFTGFPWALPAYGWAETPVIQMVSLIGPHGLGVLILLALVLIAQGGRQTMIGLVMFALMWGFGSYRLAQPVQDRAEPFMVRIIQPNADQKLKWLPEFQSVFFGRQLGLTAASPSPDMVIWPEAAIPFLPSLRQDLMQRIAAAADGAAVITGTRRRDAAGNWYNGLVMLDQIGGLVGEYNKHHLVPFGEYFPLSGLLSETPLAGLTGTGFTAGEGPQIIDANGVPPFLPLICYEAIFPQHARVAGVRPDWIVQITNDAWFGKLSGPYQHLAQSRVRAIEQGLPLARSANTGISGMIDPYGRLIIGLPLGTMGAIDVALPAALPQTLYGKTGDWPIAGILLLLIISQQISGKSRRT
ncbi:MAG: apolipoprotein N-acyltransferase [Alphaproteobacteria bacterium]